MNNQSSRIPFLTSNLYLRWFFLVMLLELILGGGGRLVAWGPISLRMVLFTIAMIWSAILLLFYQQRLPREIWRLVGLFSLTLIIAAFIGFLNNAPLELIFEDIKPLSFFYSIIFFSLVIGRMKDGEFIARIIKNASLFLAICYLLVFIAINFKIISFINFYQITKDSGEFYFRGEIAFFYKGFVFLCVGIIFFFFDPVKKNTHWLILLSISIILTFTRGFIFALSVAFLAHYLFMRRNLYKAGLSLLVATLTLFYANDFYLGVSQLIIDAKPDFLSGLTTGHSWAFDKQGNQIKDIQLLGDKNWSDIIRRRQIQQVSERISIPSFLIGHGFGVGVPVRKIHMEITYLEIFHKQGLIGLVFWLILFSVIWYHYRQAVLKQQGAKALPFFMGALFIFIQSVTNHYINNPIGLTMVLLALVVLKVLSKTPERPESLEMD